MKFTATRLITERAIRLIIIMCLLSKHQYSVLELIAQLHNARLLQLPAEEHSQHVHGLLFPTSQPVLTAAIPRSQPTPGRSTEETRAVAEGTCMGESLSASPHCRPWLRRPRGVKGSSTSPLLAQGRCPNPEAKGRKVGEKTPRCRQPCVTPSSPSSNKAVPKSCSASPESEKRRHVHQS